MLHFAQQPARPALRSIGGGKPAALDTCEGTLQACREAGVELQVSGVEEGATGLVVRRRKSSTGDVPADLRGAIRRHKTAMPAMANRRFRPARNSWMEGEDESGNVDIYHHGIEEDDDA